MNRLAALSPPAAMSQTEDLWRWTARGLTAALVGSATLLAWRRLAGALGQPLEAAPLAAVGLAWCCAAALVRWSCRPVAGGAGEPTGYVGLSAVLSVATVVFGLSLSVAGTGGVALAVLWTVLVAFEAAGWRLAWRRSGLARPPRTDNLIAPQPPARPEPSPESPGLDESLLNRNALDAKHDERVVQHWVRTELSDGRQSLRGVVRVPLAAGQRSACAHVVFCPPFPHTPHIEAQSAEGPAVRIKTGQAAPFGARLDLKLSEPAAEPVVVELRIDAVADQ